MRVYAFPRLQNTWRVCLQCQTFPSSFTCTPISSTWQSNSSFNRMGPSKIERELQVLVWQTITLVFV